MPVEYTQKQKDFISTFCDDFKAEIAFMKDCKRGRSTRRKGFIEQGMGGVLSLLSSAGGDIGSAIATVGEKIAEQTFNRLDEARLDNAVGREHFSGSELLSQQIHQAACTIALRYGQFIETCTPSGVYKLAICGVDRIMEYTTRKDKNGQRRSWECATFLEGLVHGLSGRWVQSLTNTYIEIATPSSSPYTAEGVYQRSGIAFRNEQGWQFFAPPKKSNLFKQYDSYTSKYGFMVLHKDEAKTWSNFNHYTFLPEHADAFFREDFDPLEVSDNSSPEGTDNPSLPAESEKGAIHSSTQEDLNKELDKITTHFENVLQKIVVNIQEAKADSEATRTELQRIQQYLRWMTEKTFLSPVLATVFEAFQERQKTEAAQQACWIAHKTLLGENLFQAVEQAVQECARCCFIAGDSGSGKSVAVNQLTTAFWAKRKGLTDSLPEMINFNSITPSLYANIISDPKTLLEKYFEAHYGYTPEQIAQFNNEKWVFFFDGWDNVASSLVHAIVSAQILEGWPNSKLFFTIRKNNLEQRTEASTHSAITIALWSADMLNHYLHLREKHDPDTPYVASFAKNASLHQLASASGLPVESEDVSTVAFSPEKVAFISDILPALLGTETKDWPTSLDKLYTFLIEHYIQLTSYQVELFTTKSLFHVWVQESCQQTLCIPYPTVSESFFASFEALLSVMLASPLSSVPIVSAIEKQGQRYLIFSASFTQYCERRAHDEKEERQRLSAERTLAVQLGNPRLSLCSTPTPDTTASVFSDNEPTLRNSVSLESPLTENLKELLRPEVAVKRTLAPSEQTLLENVLKAFYKSIQDNTSIIYTLMPNRIEPHTYTNAKESNRWVENERLFDDRSQYVERLLAYALEIAQGMGNIFDRQSLSRCTSWENFAHILNNVDISNLSSPDTGSVVPPRALSRHSQASSSSHAPSAAPRQQVDIWEALSNPTEEGQRTPAIISTTSMKEVSFLSRLEMEDNAWLQTVENDFKNYWLQQKKRLKKDEKWHDITEAYITRHWEEYSSKLKEEMRRLKTKRIIGKNMSAVLNDLLDKAVSIVVSEGEKLNLLKALATFIEAEKRAIEQARIQHKTRLTDSFGFRHGALGREIQWRTEEDESTALDNIYGMPLIEEEVAAVPEWAGVIPYAWKRFECLVMSTPLTQVAYEHHCSAEERNLFKKSIQNGHYWSAVEWVIKQFSFNNYVANHVYFRLKGYMEALAARETGFESFWRNCTAEKHEHIIKGLANNTIDAALQYLVPTLLSDARKIVKEAHVESFEWLVTARTTYHRPHNERETKQIESWRTLMREGRIALVSDELNRHYPKPTVEFLENFICLGLHPDVSMNKTALLFFLIDGGMKNLDSPRVLTQLQAMIAHCLNCGASTRVVNPQKQSVLVYAATLSEQYPTPFLKNITGMFLNVRHYFEENEGKNKLSACLIKLKAHLDHYQTMFSASENTLLGVILRNEALRRDRKESLERYRECLYQLRYDMVNIDKHLNTMNEIAVKGKRLENYFYKGGSELHDKMYQLIALYTAELKVHRQWSLVKRQPVEAVVPWVNDPRTAYYSDLSGGVLTIVNKMSDKDATIGRLTAENAALESRNTTLESRNATLESRNATLESRNAVLVGKNAAQGSIIKDLEKQLLEKEEFFKKQIDELKAMARLTIEQKQSSHGAAFTRGPK